MNNDNDLEKPVLQLLFLISNCYLNFESNHFDFTSTLLQPTTAVCYCLVPTHSLLYYSFEIVFLYNYKMATHNLQIDINGHVLGLQTFLFDLEESALDYIQQAGKHIIVIILLKLFFRSRLGHRQFTPILVFNVLYFLMA